MQLDIQKRLAGQVLKTSEKNIRLDPSKLDEIKEAITKADIKSLIKHHVITARAKRGISRFRIRHRNSQKRKGRLVGHGSRKGGEGARLEKKVAWANKIRVQRKFLQNLRDKGAIDPTSYRMLYMKSKGGFFRSKRHIQIYMQERGIGKPAAQSLQGTEIKNK